MLDWMCCETGIKWREFSDKTVLFVQYFVYAIQGYLAKIYYSSYWVLGWWSIGTILVVIPA